MVDHRKTVIEVLLALALHLQTQKSLQMICLRLFVKLEQGLAHLKKQLHMAHCAPISHKQMNKGPRLVCLM